jgi:hypothetical protein
MVSLPIVRCFTCVHSFSLASGSICRSLTNDWASYMGGILVFFMSANYTKPYEGLQTSLSASVSCFFHLFTGETYIEESGSA